MKTASEVMSIGFGSLGFLLGFMALISVILDVFLAAYFYLGLHILTLVIAFPLVVRALYLIEDIGIPYFAWLIGLSTLNFLMILPLHVLMPDPYNLYLVLAIAELLPITMIVFHFYIEYIEDHPVPASFHYPFL